MELVYLWVEDYKNIKNQGFNFSPRFECGYKNNELTITEKKDYTSVFPSNINVTAIVGENGSGKSNLLKSIFNYDNGLIQYYFDKNFNRNFQQSIHKKIDYLFYNKDNNSFFTLKNSIFNIIFLNKNKIQVEEYNANLLSCISYFHSYIDLQFRVTEQIFKNTHFISNENIKYDKVFKHILPTNGHIAHYLLESYHLKKIIENFDKIKLPEDFIYPDILEITPNGIIFDDPSNKEDFLTKLWKKEEILNTNVDFFQLLRFLAIKNIFNKFQKDIEKVDRISILDILDRLKIVIPDYVTNIDTLENKIRELSNIKNKKNFVSIRKNKNILLEIIQIHDKIVSEGEGLEILKFEMDNPKLSDGQLQYIKLFALINDSIKKEKNYFIILDEIELFMHPNWKKQFLNLLIKILKLNFHDKKFHIIFTTHSPFLLSDIPKENVIFLEKGKQVYPDIETFGTNIHTLLSHGFFMKDGLMGEFAKGKIDEAIKILNQKKLNEEDIKFCENIISIVGEPILKRQMQKMLDSKRLTKIDALESEIELMQKKLKLMKKNKW